MYNNDVDMNTTFTGNNNMVENEMNIDVDIYSNNQNVQMQQEINGGIVAPITEALQEKCVHRTIVHEVPHICPIRTRVINHHVYKHTYRPEYSCCEENTVTNVQCGSCCNFN